MISNLLTEIEYDYLLSVEAVQDCAEKIFQLTQQNKTHFHLHLEKLPMIAERVIDLIQQNYPDGNIPLHSRWRHFEINGEDRSRILNKLTGLLQAKARIDLTVISVLLDAGAGKHWKYRDSQGMILYRSEGLAIASLELFLSGFFSSNPDQPWRVDSRALQQMTLQQLEKGLQVNRDNPILGLQGRWELLQKLGQLEGRPAALYENLYHHFGSEIAASDFVKVILRQFNSIWPGNTINGYALGDAWEYSELGWVPFHKLSLWLAFSLIEPLQIAGITITNLEKLPGLAEYRNGGLFIDGGVLTLKDPSLAQKIHQPGDAVIIEWRALTIALLARLASLIREKLNRDEKSLSLVHILQGGTWQAGRDLARQRDLDMEPPIKYHSTGTIF